MELACLLSIVQKLSFTIKITYYPIIPLFSVTYGHMSFQRKEGVDIKRQQTTFYFNFVSLVLDVVR